MLISWVWGHETGNIELQWVPNYVYFQNDDCEEYLILLSVISYLSTIILFPPGVLIW